MKKFIAALLFTLLIFSVESALAKKYNVNFKNIPMKDFITFVSEFTGKNVIFNENDVRGNVTINSQKDMDDKEILDVFYSVLKMNGYLPVVSGNNIQIIAEKDVPLYDENIVINNKQAPESYVTSVVSLDFYNASTLLPVLNRIKSRSGYIEIVKGLNILVVRDMTSRINKMLTVIKEVDKEANTYKFHTIQLNFAVASKVEQQIIKLYGELGKSALNTTSPVIVSDDISNTLIIAATDSEFSKINYLIKTFDSRGMAANMSPKVYYLKNAKAEDVEKVLSSLIGSIAPSATGAAGGQGTNANVKTNIASDKATNSIIAIGTQELYANLGPLIDKMDVARRQVFIEALILETSIDKSLNFGVEWFGAGSGGAGSVVGGYISGGALSGLSSGTATGLPSGFNLGVIGNIITFNGLSFPSIGAMISAMETTSGVNIVSNPQILTLDNEEAEVFVGENRPYVTSEKFDSNNNPIQTFDYRNVGVRFKVRPQISSNDMVTLAIEQEVNKLSASTDYTSSSPITLNRTTKTTAKLQNKSIMIISGMIKDDSTVGESGIPFLSKIPVLGWLFKSRSNSNEKTNLMVFISAQIIDTVEDAKSVMKVRENTINQFNEEANKSFGKSFTDRGSRIDIKDRAEGRVPDNSSVGLDNTRSKDNATILEKELDENTKDNNTVGGEQIEKLVPASENSKGTINKSSTNKQNEPVQKDKKVDYDNETISITYDGEQKGELSAPKQNSPNNQSPLLQTLPEPSRAIQNQNSEPANEGAQETQNNDMNMDNESLPQTDNNSQAQ